MNSENKSIQLQSIHLKNLRCFDDVHFDLGESIVLIYGPNGSGKTSLLEALYYACYMRSFRTHSLRDVIKDTKESFFIELKVSNTHSFDTVVHTLSIGCSGNKRLVKIDGQAIVSYKDLLEHYRIVSLTEDDLQLIKGGPEERRSFIDKVLFLSCPEFMALTKEYKLILEQRNALLYKPIVDNEVYYIWTQKLWDITQRIQQLRKTMLEYLQSEVKHMITSSDLCDKVDITFSYQAKRNSDSSFDQFWKKNSSLLADEIIQRRSLFGSHLDDFVINFSGKNSRAYSSRGQQKMVVLLIKAAQIKKLTQEKGPAIFLLDDFVTDFDPQKSLLLLPLLLKLQCQLVFTSPHPNSLLENAVMDKGLSYKILNF
jgi:DNA replication and repair protein RecF